MEDVLQPWEAVYKNNGLASQLYKPNTEVKYGDFTNTGRSGIGGGDDWMAKLGFADNDGFNLGSTVDTIGGVADLYGSLQGLGLFGGDPRLNQQQEQFDKQYGLAQTTMENQRIAAQNQQNRGAATRAAANGGVDNRERYVSSPDYKKPKTV